MLEFRPRKRSEDMTPIVRDVEISKYAEAVLKEYMPEQLEKPRLFDVYKFAEQYLGSNIEILYIYTDSEDDFIAGAAIFNPQKVKIFDKDRLTTDIIMVPGNTILLDEQITGRTKKGFERFTVLHEAGHLLMHREVYQMIAERRFYVGGSPDGRWGINSALCMRSNIGCSNKLVTSLDFREHQANTFAASMLMPPRVFIPYVQNLIDVLDYVDGEFIIYESGVTDCTKGMVYKKILRETAHRFGVSQDAVKVQLTKYGLHALANDDSIYEARRRLKMYHSLWAYEQ